MKKIVGVVLLGFGLFTSWVCPAMIALEPDKALGSVVCVGVFCVPPMLLGIVLLQSAARDDEKDHENVAQQDSARSPTPTQEQQPGWVGKVNNFDLNRFTWAGWLLFISTFYFVIYGIAMFVRASKDLAEENWVQEIVSRGMFFVALAYFFGLRWLLEKLGVRVVRKMPFRAGT